jgi:hypothetical protein
MYKTYMFNNWIVIIECMTLNYKESSMSNKNRQHNNNKNKKPLSPAELEMYNFSKNIPAEKFITSLSVNGQTANEEMPMPVGKTVVQIETNKKSETNETIIKEIDMKTVETAPNVLDSEVTETTVEVTNFDAGQTSAPIGTNDKGWGATIVAAGVAAGIASFDMVVNADVNVKSTLVAVGSGLLAGGAQTLIENFLDEQMDNTVVRYATAGAVGSLVGFGTRWGNSKFLNDETDAELPIPEM